MIIILEYNAGNLTSVKRSLDYLNIPCEITSEKEALLKAQGIIFPGVGAAGSAMDFLRKQGLDLLLKEAVFEKKIPLLGICLGSQIVLEYSKENNTSCLGLIPGYCDRFDFSLTEEDGTPINIPHMGWNKIRLKEGDHILFKGINLEGEFYFVHSYFPVPDESYCLGFTSYGIDFCSFLGREGLWAVQFHPEKSGRLGLKLLENFYRYCRER